MDTSRRAILGAGVILLAGCLGGDGGGDGTETVVNDTFARDISEWAFNASAGDKIRIESKAVVGTDGYSLTLREQRAEGGGRLLREVIELGGVWTIDAPITGEYELSATTFGGRSHVEVTVIPANP